jgi:N-methylhydantoinase A
VLRLGIDVGGTFVDLVCVLDNDEIRIAKVPSDPSNLISAIETGLESMSCTLSDVSEVAIGTTLGTNTVIEKTGARTALLCTQGFRDILELQRWHRRHLYDLQQTKPEPLAPRHLRFGVPERVAADGEVLLPVEPGTIERLGDVLAAEGVESVAICFLNAHQNGENEREARRLLMQRDRVRFVSLSSEISPLIGEWERTSTTVVNAYVQPVMNDHLSQFEAGLKERSAATRLAVMQSNGGIISVEQAVKTPVRTILSGPAAGVVSAALAEADGDFPDLITMDMGGTSCDVAVIQDGEPELTNQGLVEYNVPISVPMLRIETIGAGGGSVIWVDIGGALQVGPGSAGANPGPACYDRGGERPTLTDAQLVLGRLPSDGLLGGGMPLRAELAEQALSKIADELGLPMHEVAAGAVRIADVKMAEAISMVTIQRGLDPRDFALLSFGGAGPLHACEIADELSIPRILVPPTPGVFSALGLMRAPVKTVALRSLNVSSDTPVLSRHLEEAFVELEAECTRVLEEHAIEPTRLARQRRVALRYPGQSFDVSVVASPGENGEMDIGRLVEAFHRRHAELYNYVIRDEVPFVVSAEVTVQDGSGSPISSIEDALATSPSDPTPARTRRVLFLSSGDWESTPVYPREELEPGHRIIGPALIDQLDSTVLVDIGYHGAIDSRGNLVMAKRVL